MSNDKLAQLFNILSIVMFSLAGASFLFAVFCFFKFKIIKIINDLTGRTAKRTIAKRRSENEKTGNKSFRPTAKAKERGTTTDKIRESEKLSNKKTVTKESNATYALGERTELLDSKGVILPNEYIESETDILSDATEVLITKSVESETDVLPSELKIIQSIVLIHTNEVIIN